jgi:hypothetical protein
MTNKQFDVTFIQPWNGRPCKAVEVSADSIYLGDSGEMVFRYNHHYTACEVITACEVPQSRLDAKAAYFKRFGTACE